MTTDLLALSPTLCDPATIRVLLAHFRLCSDQPGGFSPYHFGDIGFVLHPLATRVRQRVEECGTAKQEWTVSFDETSAADSNKYYEWLGKNLSWPEPRTAPLYQGMYDELMVLEAREPFPMWPNVRHLQKSFALNEAETRILILAACLDHSDFGFAYLRIERPMVRMHRAIAAAIEMPLALVVSALAPGSPLMQAGLFKHPGDGTVALTRLLELSRFGQRVFAKLQPTSEDLFNMLLAPLPAPVEPEPLQWPELAPQHSTVQAILGTALANAEAGINILLYGRPGTGKTEFAKHLAHASGYRAYQVACHDDDGNEASREERLCSLRTAQSLLGPANPALLVLDEAEDVFQEKYFNGEATQRIGSKAWMNRQLETNPRPVIWITNSIADIDPAYQRRFTFSIRFDVPDIVVRRQIAQRHLHPVGVSDSMIERFARRSRLSPAAIACCAKVVRLAAGNAGAQDDVARCHLDSLDSMMSVRAMSKMPSAVTRFDATYLQIAGRFSAQQVMDAIARHGRGTVLMSGPPGTGKTQLAARIAECSGRQLLYYSASDVNSKWFGESEQRVAEMFSSCDPERELIFLDEAETLLSDRSSAVHHASEAVTAEFLRQIDMFDGVFLCATNYGANIDHALIRRFVFRLDFKPLSARQREQLFRELLEWPAQQELPSSALHQLERMNGLTPGDFANVKKRLTLIEAEATLDDWLAELQQEWQAKPEHVRGTVMGFV